MKLWMKLAGTALVMAAAAACAASAIGGIASAAGAGTAAQAEFDYVPSCSLAEAERRGVHSSLMKFARRNVNFGCRFDGAMKVLGAYYCLIPPRAEGVCQSGG